MDFIFRIVMALVIFSVLPIVLMGVGIVLCLLFLGCAKVAIWILDLSYKGAKMKTLIVLVLIQTLSAGVLHAFDRSLNPDRYASVGLDISTGKLAGIQKDVAADAPHTDGGFVKGLLDLRVPISNALTVHAFGSSTGVNNNLQFSEGTEVGVGLRVYLQ
jgi:hypothetical protein